MHPIVKISNLELSFQKIKVFDDFNMSVFPGEKIILSGVSGAGKTSLMNLILGFIKPQRGIIEVSSLEMNKFNIIDIRRSIAWLPQNPNIIGKGKISEIIDRTKNYSFNKAQNLFDNMEDIFEELGLNKDVKEAKFEDLSGGEKQRFGIAFCIMLNRDIIMLDEPTASLDKISAEKAAELIFRMGKTIISTSHDESWKALFDREINISREHLNGN